MIIDPKYVKFENSGDVVTYITRGLPPTRNQFRRVMNAVNCGGQIGDVVISRQDVANWTNSEYVRCEVNKILEEVYKNRVRNRNIAIASAVVIIIGGIVVTCNLK